MDVVATLGREGGREGETAHSEAAKTAAEQSPGTLPTADKTVERADEGGRGRAKGERRR